MSENDENGTTEPVSMSKQPKATGGTPSAARPAGGLFGASRAPKAQVANQPLPMTMLAVFAAMIFIIIGSLIRVFAIGIGHTSALTTYLIYANSKAKKPKNPYTAADITKDLHSIRVGTVANAVLLTVLMLVLIWGLRRARSAWASRWVAVIVLVLTESFLYVVPVKHLLGLANVGGVMVGLASIVTLLGLFVPQSAKYIAACRELSLPPERRGQPRPKLFGPRTAPAARSTGPSARNANRTAASARPSSSGGGKAKAKARNDADAVARGAELARSRARASKSRRTDA